MSDMVLPFCFCFYAAPPCYMFLREKSEMRRCFATRCRCRRRCTHGIRQRVCRCAPHAAAVMRARAVDAAPTHTAPARRTYAARAADPDPTPGAPLVLRATQAASARGGVLTEGNAGVERLRYARTATVKNVIPARKQRETRSSSVFALRGR